MILRSGRMIGSDQVIINFAEASLEWRKNKIHLGEGVFRYKRYSERIFKNNLHPFDTKN